MRGSRRGRATYLITRAIVLLYLWAASMGWIYPEIFSLSGAGSIDILHNLLLHKMPDLLVLALLFLPAASRQFFSETEWLMLQSCPANRHTHSSQV